MLENYKSPITATVVERLLHNQSTINGSTNMDEFGMGSGTYHSIHQPTLNPFSLPWLIPNILRIHQQSLSIPSSSASLTKFRKRKREEWVVPGGSSGGAAVSVAVGSALGAIGSDTGGSVRQPASFLGIYGFKPTYGRIPRYGLIPYASSLDTIGILNRTLDDIIQLYSISHGFDPRDDTSIRNVTTTKYNESISSLLSSNNILAKDKPLQGLRIGIPKEYYPQELNSTTLDYWEKTAKLLSDAGAEVVIVSLPATPKSLSAYYILAPAEAASNLARYDGVRYGYRAKDEDPSVTAAESINPTHNASALLDLYARTRSEAFGAEVQRRILLGNFVLSSEARGQYYDIAVKARDELRYNFAQVFRYSESIPMEHIHYSPISRKNIAAFPLADAKNGVDILLTPVSPILPWHIPSETTVYNNNQPNILDQLKNPTDDYLNDIMTIPTSLAHLPAISIPVGSIPYPRKEYDTQINSYLENITTGTDTTQISMLKDKIYQYCHIPIGLQLIGRHSDEYTVLHVAKVLEQLVNYKLPTYITHGTSE